MKLKCFLLLALYLTQHTFSFQQISNWTNLVPNYSFENVTTDYPRNDHNPPDMTCPVGSWSEMRDYWADIHHWTLPARRYCVTSSRPGTPDVLTIAPFGYGYGSELPHTVRSGIRYGHGTQSEYLVVELSQPLVPGRTYFFECFSNNTGKNVLLSKNRPKQCDHFGANLVNGPFQNILSLENSIVSDANQKYTRARVYFSPVFEAQWLTIGSDSGGGQVEDVRIYEVGENFCRDNWYFDNTVFNYPFEFFQASDKIYVGNGVDPENGINHIPGDVIQYANTSVVLQAQNQIIIENTFIMEPGSTTLIIENKPCQATLCPELITFQNHILCDIPSMEIGTNNPNAWGTNITWSPATNLSNPNISNPIFTVPSGSAHGAIQYTVTVNYTCDTGIEYIMSYPVTVEYSNAGDPTASISASNVEWDVYNFSAIFNFNEGVSKIEIAVPGYPGYYETFYKGSDFNCCSFSWQLPDAWEWSSCQNDVILVKATNMCSGQEQTITLQWSKTQIPYVFPDLPNVFSPNGDGVNDEYFVWVPSADYYSYLIDNRWGIPMNDVTIFGQVTELPVTDNPLILWAPQQHEIPDGVYYLYLELRDLCGNIQHGETYFHLVNGRMQSFSDNDNYEAQTWTEQVSGMDSEDPIDLANLNQPELVLEKVTIYPNPNNGTMHINSRTPFEMVRIFDYAGTLVFESNVNKTDFTIENHLLASGIYFVEVSSINGVHRQRISVQH